MKKSAPTKKTPAPSKGSAKPPQFKLGGKAPLRGIRFGGAKKAMNALASGPDTGPQVNLKKRPGVPGTNGRGQF